MRTQKVSAEHAGIAMAADALMQPPGTPLSRCAGGTSPDDPRDPEDVGPPGASSASLAPPASASSTSLFGF